GGLALLAALVLAVVTTQPSNRLSRALSTQPLVAVGIISYGLYLYHWPIYLWLSPERTHLSGLVLFSLRLILTFRAPPPSYCLVSGSGPAVLLPPARRPPAGAGGGVPCGARAPRRPAGLLVPAPPPPPPPTCFPGGGPGPPFPPFAPPPPPPPLPPPAPFPPP